MNRHSKIGLHMLGILIVKMSPFLTCFAIFLTEAKLLSSPTTQEHLLFPDGYHLLQAKAIDGTLIELEEGSQFKVVDADMEIVCAWAPKTPLTISGNSTPIWIRAANYYIINQEDHTYVRAQYHHSPIPNHPQTNFIYHIDPFYGEIYLRNGAGRQSYWEVDPEDLSLIRDWEADDTVLIGINDSLIDKWFSTFKCILINYKHSKDVPFVRATCRKPWTYPP